MTKGSKIIFSLAILLLVGATLVGAQGVPGERPVSDCCLLKHELKNLSGDEFSRVTNGTGHTCDKGGSGTNFTIRANQTLGGSDGTCLIETTDHNPDCISKRMWGAYCVIDTIYTITDWIFWIAFVIAAVIIIIGGIMFMTAVGNPEKAKTARNVLVFGLIGIIIAVLAKLIPAFARFFVGA